MGVLYEGCFSCRHSAAHMNQTIEAQFLRTSVMSIYCIIVPDNRSSVPSYLSHEHLLHYCYMLFFEQVAVASGSLQPQGSIAICVNQQPVGFYVIIARRAP